MISLALVLRGAGFAAALVPAMTVSYRQLPPTKIPFATSAIRTFQQIGGSLGVAVFSVTLQRETVHAIANASGRPSLNDLAGAFDTTYWWVVAALVIAALPVLFIAGGGAPRPQSSLSGQQAATQRAPGQQAPGQQPLPAGVGQPQPADGAVLPTGRAET